MVVHACPPKAGEPPPGTLGDVRHPFTGPHTRSHRFNICLRHAQNRVVFRASLRRESRDTRTSPVAGMQPLASWVIDEGAEALQPHNYAHTCAHNFPLWTHFGHARGHTRTQHKTHKHTYTQRDTQHTHTRRRTPETNGSHVNTNVGRWAPKPTSH